MEHDSAIAGISRGSLQVRIPDQEEPPKPAEVYEVDQHSYFHVSFCDVETCAQYEEMVEKMKVQVKSSKCLPRGWLNYPGMDCIIEYNGRRGGSYVRGKIMYVLDGIKGNPTSRDYVKCQIIDDFLEVVVHRTQLFPSSLSITEYPPFVMKCKLESMDMFLDSPVLKELYKVFMNGELAPMDFPFLPGLFLVQVLSKPAHPLEDEIPTVRIFGRTWDHGCDLTDVLQQHLPTFKPLEYPQLGECPSVKITYCDGKGDVWYQPIREEEDYQMISVIEKRLALYNDGYLESSSTRPKIPQSSWKIMFCEEPVEGVCGGGGILYIFKDKLYDQCFRVKKLFKFDEKNEADDRWYVLYVDYGCVYVVHENDGDTDKPLLLPACQIDQNLCFIPPQCLPARFIGASCNIGGHTTVDVRKFWKYLGVVEESIVKIQIKSYAGDESLGLAPVDVEDNDELLDRMVPAIFVDHGFNYLPLPCRPLKYAHEEIPDKDEMLPSPAFYESAMDKFDRQTYMEGKKNQPVSLFVKEFIMKLENSGGRLDGGLLVPQLDIFLEVKGKEEEGLKSLYQVYHELEFCDKHGPKIPFEWDWSMVSPTPTLEMKIEDIKDDSEVDSGLGSFVDEESDKSSKGSTEDVNLESCSEKSRQSWVDWAVTTFGINQNAKESGVDEKPAEKQVLPPPKDAIVNCNTGELWGQEGRKPRQRSQRFAKPPVGRPVKFKK